MHARCSLAPLDNSNKTVLLSDLMSTISPDLKAGLDAALAAAGTQNELVRRINLIAAPGRTLTQPAVAQWKYIPLERVSEVAKATGVPKHILRPDQHDPPTKSQESEARP